MSIKLGIAVTAFGANDVSVKAWQAIKSEQDNGIIDELPEVNDPIENLNKFAVSMRESSPGAFIELGCPPDSLTFSLYRELVMTIKPDGLRVFGCNVGIVQEEYMNWVARLHKNASKRYVITSASGLRLLEHDVNFPRMLLVGRKNVKSQDASELVQVMLKGAFTLSAGATVVIEEAAEVKEGGPDRKLFLSIDLRLLSSVQPWQLIIYSENGVVHRRPLYDSRSKVQKIPLTISLPSGTKWLRAEVRGASRQNATSLLFERGDGMHLATTNFIAVDSLIASY